MPEPGPWNHPITVEVYSHIGWTVIHQDDGAHVQCKCGAEIGAISHEEIGGEYLNSGIVIMSVRETETSPIWTIPPQLHFAHLDEIIAGLMAASE
jgi:hypothetical protein